MPEHPKDETPAEEPPLNRKRRRAKRQDLRAHNGLPPLPPAPVIPVEPGPARWSAMIEKAHTLISKAADDQQAYHDERGEEWAKKRKTDELIARLKGLQESIAQLPECEQDAPG